MRFSGLRQAFTLTRKPIIAWAVVLLVFQVLLLAFLIAGSFGAVAQYGPSAVSFVSFYAAGQLAAGGHPALAYDQTFHYLAEEALTRPGIHYVPFLYPPVYLLLFAPLALLPPLSAVVVFEATTLAIYLFVVRRILNEGGGAWLIPALAFPATFWTIGYGQNAFLVAALLGGGTLLVDRRPLVAGVLFGALSFKPHFALLVPIALIAGGRWSAIVAAAFTVIVLVGISFALFGWETWRAYLFGFFGSTATYDFELGHANSFALISPFAGARLVGLSINHARVIQLATTLAAAFVVGWVWKTGASLATRGAVLAAGALIAVPYALLYDLMVAAIAGAWMIRAERESGSPPWERPALATVYLLPLFAFQASLVFRLPFAPLASLILAFVCGARGWREYGKRRAKIKHSALA